jgi:SagB-type dehydrogenase family enzyme
VNTPDSDSVDALALDEARTRADLVSLAVFANSYRNLNIAADATGFRTNGLRYRSWTPTGQSHVAEDFLLATRLTRGDRETEASVQSYFRNDGLTLLSLAGLESPDRARVVSLPKSLPLQIELGEAIERRRSVRQFTGDSIDLAELATILRSANGVTREALVHLEGDGDITLALRSVASGGGLYPVELYCAILNVRRLDPAVYRFDPVKDRLVEVPVAGGPNALLDAFAVPEELVTLRHAAVIFLFIGHPWRSLRKYGSRGVRYLFLEAGAIGQNIHLAVGAAGYGSVDCASVFDDEIHEALEIDGLYQVLLHTVIMGVPAE